MTKLMVSLRRKFFYGFVFLFLSAVLFLFIHVCIPVRFQASFRVVDIPKHASVYHISRLLKKTKLIRSAFVFNWYVRLSNQSRLLQAGTFRLSTSQSMVQLVRTLREPKDASYLIKLVVPEGFAINQIARRLEKNGVCKASDFSSFAHRGAKLYFSKRFSFLNDIPVDTIEGYLFPDTYYFSKGMDSKRVIREMLFQFEKRIFDLWLNHDVQKGDPKQRFSFHQVLTIASLIEKEAFLKKEMPLISAVFYNRLKKKMLLASCASVFYALDEGHRRRLYYQDLKVKSPYNTYQHSGFPPSPISSLGVKAFQSSLMPAEVPYLFFVVNEEGAHHFSEFYDRHMKVQGYR